MSRDLNLQVRLSAIDKMTGPLRKIMQGSSGLARVLRTSGDQVKEFNQQQRDVTGEACSPSTVPPSSSEPRCRPSPASFPSQHYHQE
jgi:hypothetical protein